MEIANASERFENTPHPESFQGVGIHETPPMIAVRMASELFYARKEKGSSGESKLLAMLPHARGAR
eukprot:9910748-Alexandrium_andersonii.AAC.1